MAYLASLVALLQAVTQLLAFSLKNPGLPQSFHESVLSQARQAVSLATEALRPSGPVVSPVPHPTVASIPQEAFTSERKIFAKPVYDLATLEVLVHQAVNRERERIGIAPLYLDSKLSSVARLHSVDQVNDNMRTTNPDKACNYPQIRHEGLTDAGFFLGDRLKNASVGFRRAGENIAISPVTKDLIYRYESIEGPVVCPEESPEQIPVSASAEEKKRIISSNIERAASALNSVHTVAWVSQNWLTPTEVVEELVRGWMHSSGHRAHIEDPYFRETGVGAAEVNNFFIVTQVFLEK